MANGDSPAVGSIYVVSYPLGEPHYAVFLGTDEDGPYFAVGTHRKRRRRRAEVDWDKEPARSWWVAETWPRPEGTTYFYDFSGMNVDESDWIEYAGEVSEEKLEEIAVVVDR